MLCRPVLCRAVLQTLAYRKILGGLAAGGLLKGDVEAMIEAEIGGIFMPHGEHLQVQRCTGGLQLVTDCQAYC